MTTVAEATIEQRVQAGARWLDAHKPGWIDLIDLDSLRMASPCRCILGQTYGSFYDAPAIKGGAAALGFDLDIILHREQYCDWGQLAAAWRNLIERRRAEAGAT